jgi:Ca2+-binding RTX toxin-like protein
MTTAARRVGRRADPTTARRRHTRLAVASVSVVVVVSVGAPAGAAAADIGLRDQSFAPLAGSPSGTKPESKLWFNRGWSASMFNPTAGAYRIYRLNTATGAWRDTGVGIDDRDNTRADALWSAATNKLYVASHVTASSGAATTAANSARLYRFTYTPATDSYRLDPGFPVTINAATSETLVIDRDSTGTLWATWTQGSRVFVNHSVGGNDASWGTPFIVPGAGTSLTSDDISSLIHFGANKIGVMWSNQADHHLRFAVHVDGTSDRTWSSVTVPTGATSDDHINLKADSAGRVFAAVKTSEATKTRPLILLLVRSAAGAWSATTFGTVADSQTRPIVLLDEQHGLVDMFATCPQPPKASGQSGGDICEKTAPLASPAFAPGIGTPVISDAGSPDMNDATSTKQNVSSTTGIVVMADNATTHTYWHLQQALAPPPLPPAPAPQPAPRRPGPCQRSFIGTAAADRLGGSPDGDREFGLAGNDVLRGGRGADCLLGGPGNDRILAGGGGDLVAGGSGNDREAGQSGNDAVLGNGGRDRLSGGGGRDRVSGGGGRDRLSGGAGADIVHGGPGDDHLDGGPGDDRIRTGSGRNVVFAESGDDVIDARNGRRDVIDCGRGRDTVRADRQDVLRRCERVIRGGPRP